MGVPAFPREDHICPRFIILTLATFHKIAPYVFAYVFLCCEVDILLLGFILSVCCSIFQVNDPSVSVFKGLGLSKEAEEYLSSHGLGNAIYSINAGDVQDDLFGQLVTCPFRVRYLTF